MRDQKTDASGKELPSGQAFVEFRNEQLALYAVRYLNNMELHGKGKGLVVDFSMEDARALFKRKEKIEKHRKLAKEAKKEQEDVEEKPVQYSEPLDLGNKRQKPVESETPKKLSRGQR